jgi:hypothetical protein
MSTRQVAAAVALASCLVTGCEADVRVSERQAVGHVALLTKRVDDDVEEVRRGVPRGARALGRLWVASGDPLADVEALRRSLDRVRAADRDLEIAKSTLFALTDHSGTVAVSDQEPDRLRGRSALAAFPALGQVLTGRPVETRGALAEAAGARNGSDEQWVAGEPVRDAAGLVRAIYLSGWSLRRFAYHLEETLKHDLVTAALRSGDPNVKQPLVYVFVFAGAKVYGAPLTPLVNSDALEKLDLTSKTPTDQPFHTTVEITGRGYGVASGRTPKMGTDVGVAVLRSET